MAEARIVRTATATVGGAGAAATYSSQINLYMGQEPSLEIEVPATDIGADFEVAMTLQDAAQADVPILAKHDMRLSVAGPYGSGAGKASGGSKVKLKGSKDKAGHWAVTLPGANAIGNYPTAKYVTFVLSGGTGATATKVPTATWVVTGVRDTRSARKDYAAPMV